MDDKYTNKISSNNEYKSTIYSSSINKNYRDLYNHLFNNSYPYRSDYIMNTSNNILFQIYILMVSYLFHLQEISNHILLEFPRMYIFDLL